MYMCIYIYIYIYICLRLLRGPRAWKGLFIVYDIDFDEDTSGRELELQVRNFTLHLIGIFNVYVSP